jgi:hypothetical protein
MLRLVVGDEGEEITVQVTIGHPQTVCYHSEPFGKLKTGSTKRGTVILSKAKDLEILRRCAPQNDIQIPEFRMDSTIEI